jgi:hypothetical protein
MHAREDVFTVHVSCIRRGYPAWRVLDETFPNICEVEDAAIDSMPCGGGDEVCDLVLYPITHEMTCDAIARLCRKLFVGSDPYALAAAVRDDWQLPFGHPCMPPPWKDANGHWCYLSFFGDSVTIKQAPPVLGGPRWIAGPRVRRDETEA